MAYTLSQYYPNMKVTVCDMQSVVDSAHHFQPSLEDCPNQANVSFVVGDFFQPYLPKAEMYVLSHSSTEVAQRSHCHRMSSIHWTAFP